MTSSYILEPGEEMRALMTQRIDLQDQTYRRLFTVLDDIVHFKKRDLSFDDVINELIDTYEENSWTHFGAGAGGG